MSVQVVGADFVNHWRPEQPAEEYHADLTAVGSGRLKVMLQSAAKFRWMCDNPKTAATSDAMKFGSLVHQAILEPNLFNKNYVVAPDFGDQRTKANREAKIEWMAGLSPSVTVCSEEELDHLKGMMDSLVRHDDAYALLKHGRSEISGYYRDPETGVKCRFRPDFLPDGLSALVDVKTTRDCTLDAFSRAIWNFRYDFQIAMYCEGVKQITGRRPEDAIFIAIEKTPPYEIAVYVADDALLERGMSDYRKCLRRLAECLKSSDWKGYQSGLRTIGLPSWANIYEE